MFVDTPSPTGSRSRTALLPTLTGLLLSFPAQAGLPEAPPDPTDTQVTARDLTSGVNASVRLDESAMIGIEDGSSTTASASFGLRTGYQFSNAATVGLDFSFGGTNDGSSALAYIGLRWPSMVSWDFATGLGAGWDGYNQRVWDWETNTFHRSDSTVPVVMMRQGVAVNIPVGNRVLISIVPNGSLTVSVPDLQVRPAAGVEVGGTLGLMYPQPAPPHEYVFVESSVLANDADADHPEVIETPSYVKLLPTVRHVALQAPSNCEDASTAGSTGVTKSVGQELLHTTCGVEMGKLERRLVQQGFSVTSWTTLDATVKRRNLAPVEAAKDLGAQVLFQVNSLERTTGNAGLAVRWEQRYYESDRTGTRGSPASLGDTDRATLRGMVEHGQQAAGDRSRLGVSFDVSAISATTGESIWFFRWNHLLTSGGGSKVSALAYRVPGGKWTQVRPAGSPATQADDTETRYSSHDVQQASVSGAAADPLRESYDKLVQDAINEFAIRFGTPKP